MNTLWDATLCGVSFGSALFDYVPFIGLNGLISKDTKVVISVYATYIKNTILASFDIKFIRRDQNNIEMARFVEPVRRVTGRVG